MLVAHMVHIGDRAPDNFGTSWKRNGAGARQEPRPEIFGLLNSRNTHRSVVHIDSLATLFHVALTSALTP